MRWIVPLSSAVALGLSANSMAEPQSNTVPGRYARPQNMDVIRPAPVPPSVDVIPAQVALIAPVETARPAPVAIQTDSVPAAPFQSTEAVPPTPAPESIQVAPVQQHQVRNVPVQRPAQGPFTRLMEIERRKNAWLRRTFFR